VAQGGKSKLSTRRMDHWTAYLMILPSIVFLCTFVLIPLFMALEKSFTDWKFYGTSTYIGFSNFVMVIKNQLFQQSLSNIVWFAAVIIPTQVIVSFLFAHVLKGMAPRVSAYAKTAVYVPTVISGVVASVIFLFIFNYQGGILNWIVRQAGNKRIAFLAEPLLSKYSVSVAALWLGFGYTSLIMYAGLQNVPVTYYEAAEVDGANAFMKLTRITIPSMRNVFILVIINMMTGTLQMFDLPYMMMNGTGGPVNSTLTPMIYIYNNFKSLEYSMGFTVSAALLLMLIIGALNSVIFTLIGSRKAQDE
jgi:multiple sugar transport system permease protein